MLGDHDLEGFDRSVSGLGPLGLLHERVGLGERGEPTRLLRAVPCPDGGDDERDDAERCGRLPGYPEPAPLANVVEEDHALRSLAVSRAAPGSTQTSPLTDAPSAAAKLPVFSEPVSTPVGR